MTHVTERDIAYIAGFFDGEGCITTVPRTGQIRLNVTQNDPTILYWIKATLGYGQVRIRKDKCAMWTVTNKADCARFLDTVGPYLKGKSQQADIARYILTVSVGQHYEGGMKELRMILVDDLTALKGRATKRRVG